MRLFLLGLSCGLLLCPLGSTAQTRSYTTCETPNPPRIDGAVDDAVWSAVDWASDFIQRDPADGAPPTAQTAFKVLYDQENLYLAFRAWDPEPEKIASVLARRDHFPGDWVEVNIDSYHDLRTGYSFTASVSGTQGDEFISEDGRYWDGNWDPIWEHRARIDEEGWTAEMRIPLSQLRYNDEPEQVWGLQVQRRIYRLEERSTWQPIPKNSSGWVSRFGKLEGIRGLKAQRQVELLPYAVARGERFARTEGNPFADGSRGKVTGGLDGKIGITSDLTLDLTVNPDFGQVEADPSEINLTAFESFFQERRPFFIEGQNIFEMRIAPSVAYGTHTRDRIFYSRRIGRQPHYRADWYESGYVDQPENSSILGAFKLTGQTGGGLSIGVLESVTALEKAEVEYDGERRQVTVEPLTNYLVGRLQQDFRNGDTQMGGLLTAVNRRIEDDEVSFLHEQAYVGGLDFTSFLPGRSYYVQGKVFASRVSGSEEAICATQTAPARYYQRPDNSEAELDPTRTTLSGHSGSAYLGKADGRLNFQGGIGWRSPGFECNDVGFMRNADEINQVFWMGYNWNQPFAVFRGMSLNFNQWNDYDFSGRHLYQAFNLNTNAQFVNQWNYYAAISREMDRVSNWELRGGPAMRMPGEWSAEANLNTDYRRTWAGGMGGWWGYREEGAGGRRGVWLALSWRPSNAMRVNIHPSLSRNENDAQYVDECWNGSEARYVYGELEQKVFRCSCRLDYSITPNLTVQLHAEPFVAAGSYSRFRRVTDPMALAYEDRFASLDGQIEHDEENGVFWVDEGGGSETYGFYDPDFNYRAFNSNLVIRWQYSPGSSLYLVWSQSREGLLPDGSFALGDDLDGLFHEHPHDVFLVKINRWLNL